MKERAHIAYDAYVEKAGGVSLVSGESLPQWGDLPREIQGAWRAVADALEPARDYLRIVWQDGPVREVGVNGVQADEVLEEVAAYLRSVNVEPHNNRHTSLAITDIESAQNWLARRTREREERGVEGTSEP